MKRRDFMLKGITGTSAIGMAGCSSMVRKQIELKSKMAEHSFEITHPKPSGGTMPMGEIGTTGIKVSKFGYGSHMPKELVPYEKERQVMIREAYDLGITLFDVYDHSELYQFEPMGRHLAPMINDVVISIYMANYEGRTVEQEIERDLRLFGRDYIDMVRFICWSPDNENWDYWEKLLRLKEKGYIRAVGAPIHFLKEIEYVLEHVPIDFVIFTYNFYHNILFHGKFPGDFNPLARRLREKGIGVITMKPFGTDWFVNPLIAAAKELDESGEISLPRAALRYIINSGLNPDTTLGGMYNLDHVYENVGAYYNPKMTSEEKKLLKKLRKVAKVSANAWMPDHYKFLEQWAADITDDEKLYDSV